MSLSTQKRIVYFVAFVDFFAVGLIIPLLSQHILSVGASHFVVGLLGSLYGFLQLVSGPLIGSWSDVRGRKPVLIVSLLAASLGYCLLGLFDYLPTIILSRILLGCFKHTQSLGKTLIADIAPEAQHSQTYGNYNSIASMGFMVGPIIGGHLSEYQNGFVYICLLASALDFVNICVVAYFIPSTTSPVKRKKQDLSDGSFSLLVTNVLKNLREIKWSVYWDVFLFKMLVAFTATMFFSNVSIILFESFNVTPKWIGYTVAINGLVGVFSGFFVGPISKLYNLNNELMMFHGCFLLIIAYTGLCFASSLTIFVVFMVALGFSCSILRVSLTEIVMQRTPEEKRGSIQGSGNSMTSISRTVAPLFAGLAQEFGSRGPIMVSILCSIIATFLAHIIIRLKVHKKKE